MINQVYERRFAISALEFRKTILVSLDRGVFAVVHPRSTLSLQRWEEPPHNDEFENMANLGFSPPRAT